MIGPETIRVRAEQADEATWQRLFPRFVEVYPGYADYIGRRQGLKQAPGLLDPLEDGNRAGRVAGSVQLHRLGDGFEFIDQGRLGTIVDRAGGNATLL